MTKKIYVIGSNVSKSLSPLIFNYWFKKKKIDAFYSYKEINNNNFDESISAMLLEKNLLGFNVTIPFKQMIINKIKKSDKHSKNIGAVNCVTNKNNFWEGTNTDWIGFLNSVKQKNKEIKKNNVVVIGYGGAAKAIIYALQQDEYKNIIIFNRTYEKIKNLKKTDNLYPIQKEELLERVYSADMVVNTTPTNPLKNQTFIKTINAVSYDAVYKPKETDFLSCFKKNNRIYGISMLLHQAIPCFERWFGITPEIDSDLIRLLNSHIE